MNGIALIIIGAIAAIVFLDRNKKQAAQPTQPSAPLPIPLPMPLSPVAAPVTPPAQSGGASGAGAGSTGSNNTALDPLDAAMKAQGAVYKCVKTGFGNAYEVQTVNPGVHVDLISQGWVCTPL